MKDTEFSRTAVNKHLSAWWHNCSIVVTREVSLLDQFITD